MQALQELYQQNPFWIWLAVGAVFVGLDVALGWGRLVWGGAAAAVLALLNLAHIHLGSTFEFVLFAVMALGGMAATFIPRPGLAPLEADRASKVMLPLAPEIDIDALGAAAEHAGPGRLVGRIGRTSSEFANGVGRVWVDGAEWSAELDGEDSLAAETLVRIISVSGGVKLRVRVAQGGA